MVRSAGPDDAPLLLALVGESFETYREFAPAGWEPPPQDGEVLARTEWLLDRPETWYVVAADAAGHAGQCGFTPVHEQRMLQGPVIPGLAHLWQLFVRRDWWGRGLAAHLHELMVDELRARGYERARLFTPAAQARARAFYERQGWRLSADPPAGGSADSLGLELVEYRLEPGKRAQSLING